MQARAQSPREEVVNAITHGVGAVIGLAALILMVSRVLQGEARPLAIAAVVIYGLSLVILFGASAAYHAVQQPQLKSVLRTLDHCAIHLLIAGTYTPFALVSLADGWGWALFGGVWGLALVGLALELFAEQRWEKVSLALYLVMGWLGLFAVVPLFHALAPAALGLVALGGVVYTAGTVFYARDAPWDHAVWHGFVLGGAGLHGVAVLGFVV